MNHGSDKKGGKCDETAMEEECIPALKDKIYMIKVHLIAGGS
jgi:hypothetical protein